MKNGSFTRQEIRDKYANSDWNSFSELLSRAPVGNHGNIGFYFLEREIVPFVKGFYYYSPDGTNVREEDWQPEVHVRAVVESQFMLVYLHSRTIGFNLKAILATGGGSKNRDILQILSNIFGVPVMVGEVTKSAALGSAYRALHGWHCHKLQELVPYSTVVGDLEYTQRIEPDQEAHQTYLGMLQRYSELLQEVVQKQ
jgi:xylulokinase